MKDSLQVFEFEQRKVRFALVDGEPWFVAKDVAEAMGYARFDSNLLLRLPEEWKGTKPIHTLT